jgi:hypothetical protein
VAPGSDFGVYAMVVQAVEQCCPSATRWASENAHTTAYVYAYVYDE